MDNRLEELELDDDQGCCEACGKVITIDEVRNVDWPGIPSGEIVACIACAEKLEGAR